MFLYLVKIDLQLVINCDIFKRLVLIRCPCLIRLIRDSEIQISGQNNVK